MGPTYTLSLVLLVTHQLSVLYTGGQGSPRFVHMTEFASVRSRSTIAVSFWCGWVLGNMALPGLAYVIRDWRTLTILTAAPGIPFVLFYL